MNANSTFKMLRTFGKGKLATDLIKVYVDAKDHEALERQSLYHASDIDDPEFADAVAAKMATKVDNRTIADILNAIARNESWHSDDIDRLAEFTADDYYAAFKELKGDHLAILVKTAMSFGSKDKEKRISARAREALVRVGGESELNKMRVAKFGIKLDDDA